MKVLIVNSVCGIRSTGRIATDIAKEYMAQGHECRIAYGRENVPEEYKCISYCISSKWDVRFNAGCARLLDNDGFLAKGATKKFLKWADNYNPDILWIHNLHGYYINIELLFRWIKLRPEMQVKWTLHDCWAFTGHCSHFSYVKCSKWQHECYKCVQSREYPKSLFLDRSKENFRRKKNTFCGVERMTLICPSKWLAELVEKSYLKDYPIQVAHNTIDCYTFKPTPSDFRMKMGLMDKKIILGVATSWGERKGLNDFVSMAESLDDSYAIVLVGIQESQKAKLPRSIICVPQTNSKKELAEIYTAADVFVNPSREETFGLTTLEAISCGTSAIVYRDTACEEVVRTYGGIAVEQSVEAVCIAIKNILKGD